MKTFVTLAIFFFSTACTGQVDSAWISQNFMPGYSKDTGLYLPAIDLVDENGNKKTLSDFKGKVLYIDVWTTWCGNCIAGFPFSKKLYARLKSIHLDTSVQFINICSEDSKRQWKKLLKKHQPEGINLYAKDTSFYKTWGIELFPRYLIIDGEGKIMAFDAPGVDDGSVDYILYAAAKGVKPAVSVWIEPRQSEYFLKYQRFTNDPEGIDYEKWFNATVAQRYADSKERQEQQKTKGKPAPIPAKGF